MNIGTFDIETTIFSSFGHKSCNPHDLRNYIVCWSIYKDSEETYIGYHTDNSFESNLKSIIYEFDLLVCHNAMFDILFLYIRYDWFRDWVLSGGKIWCTMLSEFLLSGQREPFISLNRASEKYGSEQKLDIIKKWWEQGIQTEDMDKDTLMEYNMFDCKITMDVFLSQINILKQQNQLKLANKQMEDLLFIIDMSYNGMYINKHIALEAKNECIEYINKLESEILSIITNNTKDLNIPKEVWNIGSNEHKSIILFGGILKYRERGPILDEQGETVLIKSKNSIHYGEMKTKFYDKEVYVAGLSLNPKEESKLKKEGYYSTNKKFMDELPDDIKLVTLLKTHSKVRTLWDKYFNGLPDMTYEKDSCVHATFNTNLVTGRMSCSKPNLQQIPRD